MEADVDKNDSASEEEFEFDLVLLESVSKLSRGCFSMNCAFQASLSGRAFQLPGRSEDTESELFRSESLESASES